MCWVAPQRLGRAGPASLGWVAVASRYLLSHRISSIRFPSPPWQQGIYSYRADFLPKFIDMPESLLQRAEDLEQNKARNSEE